jgi:hypothetical protein
MSVSSSIGLVIGKCHCLKYAKFQVNFRREGLKFAADMPRRRVQFEEDISLPQCIAEKIILIYSSYAYIIKSKIALQSTNIGSVLAR